MRPFLVSLILLAASLPAPAADMLVSPSWLKDNLNDPKLVLFHVGTKPEFDKEHIPGAQLVVPQDLSIPRADGALMIQMLPADALKEKLQSLGVSDDSRIVVYFGSNLIAPTTRVYFTLDVAGLGDQTSILDGGMPAWKAAGGPVTTEVTTRAPGRITKTPRPELLIGAEEILPALGGKTLNIVDARLPEFFDGTNAGAMPRAGRIPGARNLPFSSLATTDLGLKSVPDLADLFKTAGVGTGDTVVSYCHTGQQATLVYFAAKRLGIKARVYDGSWDEWSRRSELPVETSPLK
jgi:thiosulfate/3-mercaptopyruvate sulfurtransferase